MMRGYLAYCPDEEPRIFRMLDLVSRGALLARPRRKMFPAVIVERRMEMGTYFGSVRFTSSSTVLTTSMLPRR